MVSVMAQETLIPPSSKEKPSDASFLFKTGLGVGAYGTVLAAATGTVCLACLLVSPTLLGVAAYQKFKDR